jgi:hypothetical protein
MCDFFEIMSAGRAFFVSAWALMLIAGALACSVGISYPGRSMRRSPASRSASING